MDDEFYALFVGALLSELCRLTMEGLGIADESALKALPMLVRFGFGSGDGDLSWRL